jgi:adenylate cyclase
VTPPPQRLTVAPSPPVLFAGSRIGLFALAGLAVLLLVGVLRVAVGTDGRFPTALRYDAQSITKSPEIGGKPAIAVLPFLNQSDDPAREYFADGLTQDIVNALGRLRNRRPPMRSRRDCSNASVPTSDRATSRARS